MLNHHNFKLNETIVEDVTLPSLIDGLNTIDYRYEGSFPTFEKGSSKEVALSDDILTQATYFDMMQHFIKDDDVLLVNKVHHSLVRMI